MGVSQTPSQLAMKLRRAGEAIENKNAYAVGAAALSVKNTMLTEVRRAVGADMRMSGVGKRGAKLGVRYDVRGKENATAIVRAVGPWQLIEGPTKPHKITSKSGHRGRGKRKPIATPYGPRMSAQHPGTRGKYPWRTGAAKAEPKAVAEYAKAQREVLVRIFK